MRCSRNCGLRRCGIYPILCINLLPKDMSYQLTPHFSLEELTASDTAIRKGIANVPPDDIVDNLYVLAAGLERVRTVLGHAIHVNSGYRGAKLNAAIGGASNSAHMSGLAADIVCPGYGSPLEVCKQIIAHSAEIGYDKMIHEGTWVHIAFPEADKKPRHIALTAHFGNGPTTYTEGIA